MSLRSCLLNLLADGEFHSGEALGAALGVSRMAVWKHLKALREMGVAFEVVRGKGYCLPASIELLDGDRILATLAPATGRRLIQSKYFLKSIQPITGCGRSPWTAHLQVRYVLQNYNRPEGVDAGATGSPPCR